MFDAKAAFEIIRSVTRAMRESRETQPALDTVVRLISEKMRVDVCSLYLHNPAEDSLVLAAAAGLNREAAGAVRLRPDEGLTGAVFTQGEILHLANPSADARFRLIPALGEERLQNFLGIPIPPGAARGRGVLVLQSTDPRPFQPAVEDLAYTLAAQVGSLLEHRGAPAPVAHALPLQPLQAPPFLRAQVAFGGIADGPVLVLKTRQVWDMPAAEACADPEADRALLEAALGRAREQTRWLREKAGALFAEMDACIFDTHALFLEDVDYLDRIRGHIRGGSSAAAAVKRATREMVRAFQDSGNGQLARHAADLRDVGLRLLNALGETDSPVTGAGPEGVVVAAEELLPSDLVYLHSRKLLGILCETGGATSHAAILARSLDVPCFIGIPGLTRFLQPGTRVILDGNSGLVYIRPDAHVVREYTQLLESAGTRADRLIPDEDRLRDGHPVKLSGNVSLLSDLQLMKRFGIKSVGLYRSEFFFMIRNSFPDEETQFEVYRQVMERCGLFGVTFRLLDVGADKPLRYFDWGREENPALGWRSIRMLLERPDILRPHLRALLRAAQLGHMRLAIPMASTLGEVREIRRLLQVAAAELEGETGQRLRLPPVGIMVEIPSAVMQIEGFLFESDFICLGTNDLIQYLFAADRGNARMVGYHHPYHPALLQALKHVADAARKAGKPVTVCGEMAGDPKALPLLIGLGLTSLSIAPGAADAVREALRQLTLRECQGLARRALAYATEEGVREEVESFWSKAV